MITDDFHVQDVWGIVYYCLFDSGCYYYFYCLLLIFDIAAIIKFVILYKAPYRVGPFVASPFSFSFSRSVPEKSVLGWWLYWLLLILTLTFDFDLWPWPLTSTFNLSHREGSFTFVCKSSCQDWYIFSLKFLGNIKLLKTSWLTF